METLVLLLIVLIVLVFICVLSMMFVVVKINKKHPKKIEHVIPSFKKLAKIIESNESSLELITEAIDIILLRYAKIKNMHEYEKVLKDICVHKNTTSAIILRFEKALRVENPKLDLKINNAIKIGMFARKKRRTEKKE